MKKEYSAHVQTLYQTGGGLTPEDTQNNLIGTCFLQPDSM